jgi:hypothetical protein
MIYDIPSVSRRVFLKAVSAMPFAGIGNQLFVAQEPVADFAKKLVLLGRNLEWDKGYVWCNSPIDGPDGNVHVFYSRWTAERTMS